MMRKVFLPLDQYQIAVFGYLICLPKIILIIKWVVRILMLIWFSKYTINISSPLFFLNSRKSEEFNLKDIAVLVDIKEQNWFK